MMHAHAGISTRTLVYIAKQRTFKYKCLYNHNLVRLLPLYLLLKKILFISLFESEKKNKKI